MDSGDLTFMDFMPAEDIDSYMAMIDTSNVVFMTNTLPDVSVLEVSDSGHFDMLVREYFDSQDDIIQFIVSNCDQTTNSQCPAFRILLERYTCKHDINYKLQTFLCRIKCNTVSSRCKAAMICGIVSPVDVSTPINIPANLYMENFPLLTHLGPIDVSCLMPAKVSLYPGCDNLSDVSGMPESIQWHIFRYLQSREASIIKKHFAGIKCYWDQHFLRLSMYL